MSVTLAADQYGSPSLDDVAAFSRLFNEAYEAAVGEAVAGDVEVEVSSPVGSCLGRVKVHSISGRVDSTHDAVAEHSLLNRWWILGQHILQLCACTRGTCSFIATCTLYRRVRSGKCGCLASCSVLPSCR